MYSLKRHKLGTYYHVNSNDVHVNINEVDPSEVHELVDQMSLAPC